MSTKKEELLFLIGGRLREERERVGLSQEQIAALLDVSTRTWGKYERGDTTPDAAILALLASLSGFDVHYVLSGERASISEISTEEQRLVENYRAMDEAARLNIQAVGDSFAQSSPEIKKDAG